MEFQNTIKIIDKYNNITAMVNKDELPSYDSEEWFFVCHIGYELAKSLHMDLGKENCTELAKVLLSLSDDVCKC